MPDSPPAPAGERLAKVMARAGVCSRRDAEGWIRDGRIAVNGKVVRTPAFNVGSKDTVTVDGAPLAARAGTRLWLYHKPPGLVVTEKDTEGRDTVFAKLTELGLPRVLSVGRLDIATEGLLLLTNDGGLKRVLELPATGWMRRYRVRAFGSIEQGQLDVLKEGIEVEGIQYGPIEASLERQQGSNVWLVLGLREGKNREVKNVLAALGLQVNRLIRVSYGPFQLGDLAVGQVEVVPARVLREQLGHRLAKEAGADFDSDMPEVVAQKHRADPKVRAAAPGKDATPRRTAAKSRPERFGADSEQRRRQRFSAGSDDRNRPGRPPRAAGPADRHTREEARPVRPRTIHFEDGHTEQFRPPPERDGRPRRDDRPARDNQPARNDRPRRARDDGAPPVAKPRSFGGGRPAPDKPRGSRPFGGPPNRSGKPDAGGAPDRPARRNGQGARPARGDAPRTRSGPVRPPSRGKRPEGGASPRGPGRTNGPGRPGGPGKPRAPRKPRA
jgi:23S rRNA pseudouridine2605 synthase